MYINMLDYIGNISNKQKCIAELKLRVKELRNLSDNKVGFKVNENHSHDLRYFTNTYDEVTEDSSKKAWMWVDSGYRDNVNCPVYLQFHFSSLGWNGALVGTADEILLYQSAKDNANYKLTPLGVSVEELEKERSYIIEDDSESNKDSSESTIKSVDESSIAKQSKEVVEKPKIEEEVKCKTKEMVIKEPSSDNVKNTKSDTDCKQVQDSTETPVKRTSLDVEKTSAFYQELYDKLLIQTGWELSSTNLRYYIEVVITRLNNFLKAGVDCSDYIVFNNDKSMVLINSGLLDKFGKDILFISKMHGVNEISFTSVILVKSKSMLLNYNFDKSAISFDLHRVRFYNKDASELVFTSNIEDFDLENWDRLSHCISDRRERFPADFANSSDEVLCSDLIKAIELGVKLSKYDTSYIKPIYNKKSDSIHYIIPYHVGNNFQKKPELGIVIAHFDDDEYWQVMTILGYDECCADVRIITPYMGESI